MNRKDTPKDADGQYNLEGLEAVDLPLLNEQLEALLKGRLDDTPKYSFQKGRLGAKTVPMRLEQNQILLMEGIHGLKDRLTGAVSGEQKFKIYVSAVTQLCIDDHNRIFTSDSRLIRRIVRHRMFEATLLSGRSCGGLRCAQARNATSIHLPT